MLKSTEMMNNLLGVRQWQKNLNEYKWSSEWLKLALAEFRKKKQIIVKQHKWEPNSMLLGGNRNKKHKKGIWEIKNTEFIDVIHWLCTCVSIHACVWVYLNEWIKSNVICVANNCRLYSKEQSIPWCFSNFLFFRLLFFLLKKHFKFIFCCRIKIFCVQLRQFWNHQTVKENGKV